MTHPNPPRDQWCHADRDGDCSYKICPQLRDGEPKATGRHCPIDFCDDDDEDSAMTDNATQKDKIIKRLRQENRDLRRWISLSSNLIKDMNNAYSQELKELKARLREAP